MALHLGEAVQLMRAMDTSSVDHVITDPPYSKHAHQHARTLKGTSKMDHMPNQGMALLNFPHIDESALRLALEEMGRVARRWVISFMDWRHLAAFEKTPPRGLDFVRFGQWCKTNPMPQMSGDRPAQGFEAIAIFHKSLNSGRMRWNGGGHAAAYHFASVRGTARVCTAQKPLPLVLKLVEQFTDPEETILDPYAGGGTMLMAAAAWKRRAIGIELDFWQAAKTAVRLGTWSLTCATSLTSPVTSPVTKRSAPTAALSSSGATLMATPL